MIEITAEWAFQQSFVTKFLHQSNNIIRLSWPKLRCNGRAWQPAELSDASSATLPNQAKSTAGTVPKEVIR